MPYQPSIVGDAVKGFQSVSIAATEPLIPPVIAGNVVPDQRIIAPPVALFRPVIGQGRGAT